MKPETVPLNGEDYEGQPDIGVAENGSKSMPGAIATPVSASSFEQNAIESVVKSETSA